jgi:DNA-binding transcriptional MerR regulator
MAGDGVRPASFRPGEAGDAIGIKPSTLRIYAQRFADLLSEDAGGSGRNGYRVFSEADVALLRQAKQLLERGFTYERAAAELRAAGYGRTAEPAPRRSPRSSAARVEEKAASEQLAILEQAVQAWRALAEERASEVAALKREVRELQERFGAARRPVPIARTRGR